MQRFPRYYTASDFELTADVVCTTGKFNKVCELVAPAQQQIAFGTGQIANGVDSRKKATLKFMNTSVAQMHGVIRLAMTNANETDIKVIIEDRSENFDDGVELAETKFRVGEDSKLMVYFQPDDTATIDFDATDQIFLMPCVVYQ